MQDANCISYGLFVNYFAPMASLSLIRLIYLQGSRTHNQCHPSLCCWYYERGANYRLILIMVAGAFSVNPLIKKPCYERPYPLFFCTSGIPRPLLAIAQTSKVVDSKSDIKGLFTDCTFRVVNFFGVCSRYGFFLCYGSCYRWTILDQSVTPFNRS